MESQSSVTLNPSQPRVAHKMCQQIIMDTLLAAIPENLMPETLRVVPIFDQQRDRYQLICQGWTAGEKRVFYPVIHIEINQGLIWIQHNQSDLDVGESLSDRGIPKSQIVLGLHPPSIRPLNPAYASGS
ncbi:XisI protein (plasmid) [Leptolyngbya sp. NIES-3755]|nr:XisI protein [Leptolyngbya sp. NIES-3755]